MENKFADLHCHPHMRSFNWLHKPRKDVLKSKYHPWYIILPKFKSAKKGKRAAAYSQCDMVQVANGNMKLAFVSLYPLEKGWVTGSKNLVKGRLIDLQKLIGDNAFNDFLSDSLSLALKPLVYLMGQDKKRMIALRDFMQAIFMKLPLGKINFYQSDKYNYFRELKNERQYILKKNNITTRSEIFIPLQKRLFINRRKIRRKHPLETDATGKYVLAENGTHVKNIIEAENMAFVLTIEGSNVFNTKESLADVKTNIKEVKSWHEPIFFITFSHHFYNYLAGHAHSIPDVGNLLLDQSEGLKEGFTTEGWEVVRLLLSLDTENNFKQEEYGHRILIDVKHLNAISRQQYYEEIIKPCMAKGDKIPIIASHVAYSGQESLTELIANMDNEVDGYFAEKNGHKFNAWNINLCDEDVLNIFKSGGLIGVNFDQRVLGIPKEVKNDKEVHIKYLWQNMKAMMTAVLESNNTDLPPKENVVELLSLGTDFDGYIDPVDKYATVLDFKEFRHDLLSTINADTEKDKFLFNQYSVEDLVEKICFQNAYDFVVEYFK